MAKTKHSTKPVNDSFDEVISSLEQLEVWDVLDAADQSFWDEFFRIEEMLAFHDELEPPQFTVTVQNHQTGEVRTFQHVRFKSSKKRLTG